MPYPSRLGRPDEYAQLVMSIVENGYLNGETHPPGRRDPDGAAMSEAILLSARGRPRPRHSEPAAACLNALNAEIGPRWREVAVATTGRDDGRAVIVLDAAGPAFCAGGDVVDMAQNMGSGAEDPRSSRASSAHRPARALAGSSIPVVAAAHGTTAGGGLGILDCSDYAIVGADSRSREPVRERSA